MEKTTTLKDFKVFVFKTLLTMLVLGMSFQASVAQQLTGPKKTGSHLAQITATQVPVMTKEMAKGDRNLVTPAIVNTGTPTDVPAINQQIAEKMSKRVTVTPNITTNTPTTNIVTDVCTFNGGLVAGDLTLTNGRFFRDGVPTACGVPKICPGPFGTGPYFYDLVTMTNSTCAVQCVTVNYKANAGGGDVFVAVTMVLFHQLTFVPITLQMVVQVHFHQMQLVLLLNSIAQ